MNGGNRAPVDFGGLSLQEIDALLDRLEPEEREISTKRRRSHERIDLMRSEVAAGISGASALAQLETWERRMSAERRALHESIDALYAERGRREAPPRRRLAEKGLRDSRSSLVGLGMGPGVHERVSRTIEPTPTLERALSGTLRRLDAGATLERGPTLERALSGEPRLERATLERPTLERTPMLDHPRAAERPSGLDDRLPREPRSGLEPRSSQVGGPAEPGSTG